MRRAHVCVRIAVLAAVVACTHGGASADGSPAAFAPNDSLEGTVRVTGVEALAQTTLVLDGGSPAIRLVGSPLLTRTTGLRVAVIGHRSGQEFAVWRFVVVGANGVATADGLLVARGDTLMLVTGAGARAVRAASPGLRAAVGHRVWISGPLDAPTVAYGVIE